MRKLEEIKTKSQYIEEITELLEECDRESFFIYTLHLLRKLMGKEVSA